MNKLFIKYKFLQSDKSTEWANFFIMPNLKYGFYFPKKLTKKYKIQFQSSVCELWVPSTFEKVNIYPLINNNDYILIDKKGVKEINLAKFKMMLEDKQYLNAIDINYVKNVPNKIENIKVKEIEDLND